MQRTWITTDTHIYHEKIKEFCNRPDNFNERILRSYRTNIKPDDVLIHLGDVAFYKEKQAHEVFYKPLRCKKILVRGNHDKNSNSFYLAHGWDFVCTSFKDNYFGKNILFSHKPRPWDGVYDYNLHGHFHNIPIESWEPELTANLTHRSVLISLEEVNYELINLEALIKSYLEKATL